MSGLVTATAYLVYWLAADALAHTHWLLTFGRSSFELVNSIWWGVGLGVIMIAVLGRIPREFVMSALGSQQGVRGILRATAAGVLLDLCSHGVLMVGAKLYERGATTGQVIAFLISSPWNSLSLTLILFALIGLPWTLGFIILSMVIAVITGVIFEKLVNAQLLPANRHQQVLPEDFQFWREARAQVQATHVDRQFILNMILDGIRESRIVARWILFGVVLASLIRAVVPMDLFTSYFGPTMLGLAVTVSAATIIEVCSEGSAPLAADIFTRAGAPGNSFVFLMGGVATDYTEIMVLKDTTNSLKLALFLPLISLPQIVLLGWLINQTAS